MISAKVVALAWASILMLTGCASTEIVDGPVPTGGDHWRNLFAQAVRSEDPYWNAVTSDSELAGLGTRYCADIRAGDDPAQDADAIARYEAAAKDHVDVVVAQARKRICPTY
ncbi:MAG TPA: DUF732 domain-containing protein [Pseudolysinimonas sp.]|nr:DUF732 domain-containing protein [Pseudolysinimonas sp.]